MNALIKSLLLILFLSYSLFAFVSCSDDDDVPSEPPYEEEDIRDEEILKSYLQQSYTSYIQQVSVTESDIEISGKYSGDGEFYLGEIPPYLDVTQVKKAPYKTRLNNSNFKIRLERRVEREGIIYDRLLSKWAIFESKEKTDQLVSHAHYADNIHAIQQLQPIPLTSKKGMGGIIITQYISDLSLLDISSGTLNVSITQFMRLSPEGGDIEYSYGGKTYYFDKAYMEGVLDNILAEATKKRNISMAAIILVEPATRSVDPELGALLQHPDYNGGAYTMPNMTNPEAVNCYAAAIDFLAKRYSTTDNRYGRIAHWIMQNEIDGSKDWANMGHKPVTVVMDAYIKSLRMCYNIVRQYDKNAEVFASLSHSWTYKSNMGWHTGKEVVDLLNAYGRAEGDFQWAIAYHSYPEDLFNPRTWDDPNATFSMNTKFITFKNLEVLSNWALTKENKYKGTTKRSVWLSEAGVNSRSYSDEDLKIQAAGFAYAWKKINGLEGIDGIQWHNWFDHPDEGGAHLGLRKFLEANQGEAKPVWTVFEMAGTSEENEYFNQFLPVIGITDWNIIQNF